MLKKLVIIPISGLANRMRAVASGVSLARKVNKTPVVIWHRDAGLNASFSDIFQAGQVPFEVIEPGALKFNCLFEMPRKRNLYLSALAPLFDRKIRIFQDVNGNFVSDDKEIEKIASRPDRDVVITSGLLFAPVDRELMNSIFTISPAVEERIKEIKRGLIPSAALQIRRTDNRNSINNSPLEAFQKIAARLVRKQPDIRIFLATDDEETKHSFQKDFPDNVFFNPHKAVRNSREGIIDAAAELYIMSECPEIYGSYWSSYSEVAALIGGRKLKVVKK